jgi:hypothetical protein
MKKSTLQALFWLTVFSIAMGYMETAVVVYLREMYYPGGFGFPLKPVGYSIAVTEIIREAATIIMLAGAGVMTGRTLTEKFGNFVYSFAVWDIFYYVFLKLLLHWPDSLLTWDLLFLIPVPWVGPVICPVINSLSMILLAFVIAYFTDTGGQVKLTVKEWTLLVTGSVIVIVSYTLDYSSYILSHFSIAELLDELNRDVILSYASEYIPKHFDWWIYIAGELLILSGIGMFAARNKKTAG